MSHIPVIDFKEYELIHSSAGAARINKEAFDRISREMLSAFKDIGFVYLKNTGISPEQQENVFQRGDAFFALHPDVKNKYRGMSHNSGWTSMLQERTNPSRPNDLLESYRIYPLDEMPWPTEEIPEFEHTMLSFHKNCTELAFRVLDVISYGLGLKSATHLRKFHETSNGYPKSVLRLLRYPALSGTDLQPGQIRLGEHTDYGSITLLFQDETGGLEIQCRDGIYRPATPIPDTVLINIGDLMQRWTSDTLVSNIHRVVVAGDQQRDKARRSVAFFISPKDDCVIECLDGSNKYPPISAGEYIQSKIKKIFKLENHGQHSK